MTHEQAVALTHALVGIDEMGVADGETCERL